MEFLQWVSAVLNDPTFTKQEDGYKERLAFERFARLRLKAGEAFDPASFLPQLATTVGEGVEEGRKEATHAFRAVGTDMNGWRLASDIGYKSTNWKLRAGYGLIALMDPVPACSHTGALGFNDSEGRPLSGGQRYTLTFSLTDMPPVTEFWEIPVYDHDGYLVANLSNRYSVNSYMLKKCKLHTEGGKLVIYIQADEPKDAEKTAAASGAA